MKQKNYWFIGVIVILLAIGVSFFIQLTNKNNNEEVFKAGDLNSAADLGTTSVEISDGSALRNDNVGGENIVVYTENGYEPAVLKVKKGAVVFFKNESIEPMWTASDLHPSHKVYPGSDIKKCSTSEKDKIFDACDGVMPGDSWSFLFNEIGQWHYHNHLNPRHTGTVIVE